MVTRHPQATCRTLQGQLVFQIRSKGGQREPREDTSHLLTSAARRRRSWSRGLNKPSDYSPRERRRRGWADQGWRRRFQKAARAQPSPDHLVGRPSWGPVASRHPGTAVQPPASASLREGEERQRRQRGGSWGRCGRGWGQRRAERCRAGRTRPRPACPPHILARALSAHLWLPQRGSDLTAVSGSSSVPVCPARDRAPRLPSGGPQSVCLVPKGRSAAWPHRGCHQRAIAGNSETAPLQTPPLAPGAQTRLSRSRGAPNGHGGRTQESRAWAAGQGAT